MNARIEFQDALERERRMNARIEFQDARAERDREFQDAHERCAIGSIG